MTCSQQRHPILMQESSSSFLNNTTLLVRKITCPDLQKQATLWPWKKEKCQQRCCLSTYHACKLKIIRFITAYRQLQPPSSFLQFQSYVMPRNTEIVSGAADELMGAFCWVWRGWTSFQHRAGQCPGKVPAHYMHLSMSLSFSKHKTLILLIRTNHSSLET